MKYIVAAALLMGALSADEGMWPFNMLPVEKIQNTYGVRLDKEWSQHVQLSCLRVSLGGSASFVSDQGLVMTNHHVGSKAIYNLSVADENLMEEGFYAKTFAEERPCPNMYVDQLVEIRDVTEEILKNLPIDPAAREKARQEAIATLTKREKSATGLQPEVVSLYQGAHYHLYLYKRYIDVRLVMAPETSIAFFGGDEDNFAYPRYNLDVCFFRVYENGRPLQTNHYLKWSPGGPVEGEALFVAGHPGKTERLATAAHLIFLRDQELPLLLQLLDEKIVMLEAFSSQTAENKRIAQSDLFRFRNAQKVFPVLYATLRNSSLIERKQKYEEGFTDLQPWLDLQGALQEAKSYYPEYFYLDGGGSRYSKLYVWARHLVRYATEHLKPNEKRLKEYTDNELPALELELFSTEPIYPHFDQVTLKDSFRRVTKALGSQHPVAAAFKAFSGETKLNDLAYRTYLYEHPEEIARSLDPLLVLATKIDPYARKMRDQHDKLEGVQQYSYEKIVPLMFARNASYPDATFTLRLSVGALKGYEEQGQSIAPTTALEYTFVKAKEESLSLPASWLKKEGNLPKGIPFNFVSTNDIIGGNSGSPVINSRGEVVGLIFDGNVQSLPWDLVFDQTQGRAISVHSQAIIDALDKIYDAQRLVKEILKKE